MTALRLTLVLALAVLGAVAAPGLARGADKPLHLVLTPSQKPTDLLATGEEFGARARQARRACRCG